LVYCEGFRRENFGILARLTIGLPDFHFDNPGQFLSPFFSPSWRALASLKILELQMLVGELKCIFGTKSDASNQIISSFALSLRTKVSKLVK
jgi:hypothetical protein